MRRIPRLFFLAFLIPALSMGGEVDFSREIRPILSAKCFSCHGPDDEHRKANLRLDLKKEAFANSVIVPKNSAASEAWLRIVSTDHDELMPPPEAKKPLTGEEKELLRRWIEEGAAWAEHWAFVKPQKSVGNSIDDFIGKKWGEKSLESSPEADRETLIRRLSFDLTGLPPTVEQVRAFSADPSPDAYEKLVDRLLVSPQYGERMALMWLDAARYGDTSVMHADGPRTMWPWRDWVVNAYNNNQPYDQFSIEQLAGDLIPEATLEQKIASGFNRHHPSSDEGGAIAEELRVSYVADRVKTTSNVWLGLSIECAQCHDHKYDPVSQKEYYQFYAYFNNTRDPGMQTRNGNQVPVVGVPDPAYDIALKEAQDRVHKASEELTRYVEKADPAFDKWLLTAHSPGNAPSNTVQPPDGLSHWFPVEDGEKNSIKELVSGISGDLGERGKHNLTNRENGGKALELNGSTNYVFPEWPEYEADRPFTFMAWVKFGPMANGAIFSRMDETNQFRGYDFWVQGNQIGAHLIHAWQGDALKVVSTDQVKPNQWQHVAVCYDGSRKAAGVKIYIDGILSPNHVEADSLVNTIKPAPSVPFKLGSRNNSSTLKGQLDDLRIYSRALSPEEIEAAKGDPVKALLAKPIDSLSTSEKSLLRNHYLAKEDKNYQKLSEQSTKRTEELANLRKSPTTAMIMTDNDTRQKRMTYLLNRGAYDAPIKDEVIEPGLPAALPPLPEGAPANRLALAYWLFTPENPLTSRVAANQLWQLFFGTGIVSTPADFGSQGDYPSHPELLDWLAVDFREGGWDVKRMVRQIVTSQTYRQASRVSPRHLQMDPENRLLARAPRFRLQAEMIRDNALSLGGLLVSEIGGPGVKPYQPPGLWEEVGLGGNPKFVQDRGEKLYRRSLYTYWKRSAPHPVMMIFDAPNRESCVLKRTVTNTPLQALAAMNDVQITEASRHFAERILKEGGSDDPSRASYAFQAATARKPLAKEIATLLGVLEQGKKAYSADPEKAKALLSAGESKRTESFDLPEHAAWTLVAGMILNLDEVLTRN